MNVVAPTNYTRFTYYNLRAVFECSSLLTFGQFGYVAVITRVGVKGVKLFIPAWWNC